jgi:hypothetical protein
MCTHFSGSFDYEFTQKTNKKFQLPKLIFANHQFDPWKATNPFKGFQSFAIL